MSEADDKFSLSGRCALVTGASRGIGRAITLAYVARGANVVAVARSAASLEDTARMAAGHPGSVTTISADLIQPDAVPEVVGEACQIYGQLDILVNNAATFHTSTVENTELSSWRRVMDLSLQSCFLLCQAASPYLAASGHGAVINVASICGIVATPNDVAYVSAKHGLIGLTRALAVEWAARNVRVNALAPGYVETAMAELDNQATATRVVALTPMRRWAQPSEIALPAVFLASDAASFMTGQVLVVDGGYTAQ